MVKDAFVKLDAGAREKALSRIASVMDTAGAPEQTAILSWKPPFYKGAQLLDVTFMDQVPFRSRAVVCHGNAATVLDYRAETVYALNAAVPLALSADNVADYARFFFGYVKGPRRLILAEDIDNIRWRDEISSSTRKMLGGHVRSLYIKGAAPAGGYVLGACILFKDGLFSVDLQIDAFGRVDVAEERLLMGGLPVTDDVFGQ